MGLGLLCPEDHHLCRQRVSAGCPPGEEAPPQVRDAWSRDHTCLQVTNVLSGGRASEHHREALSMFLQLAT